MKIDNNFYCHAIHSSYNTQANNDGTMIHTIKKIYKNCLLKGILVPWNRFINGFVLRMSF